MHDDDEALKPTYNTGRPRWMPAFSSRKYDGRKSWYSELGHSDAVTEGGLLQGVQPIMREYDRQWYDPKVPDGTSKGGLFGLDTVYHRDQAMKADTPGDLEEFRQKVMKGSAHYKAIAEKFDLSPEHPGLSVSPNSDSLYYRKPINLGSGLVWPTYVGIIGPQFFNKPLNEGCLEKGLALAKFALYGSFVYGLFDFKSDPNPAKNLTVRDVVGRSLRAFPIPGALAFGYGVAICTSATVRNRDDFYNPLYAAAFTGFFYASMKQKIGRSIGMAAALSVFGLFWQYMRIFPTGIQGRTLNRQYAGMWTGPLAYDFLDFGHADASEMPEF